MVLTQRIDLFILHTEKLKMKGFTIKTEQYEKVIPVPGTINNLGQGEAGCKKVIATSSRKKAEEPA
jgi:hypothetical protein